MRNLKNKSIKTVFFGLLLLLVVCLLVCGCGVKGNPIPHGLVLPPGITDLTVVQTEGGNKLSWTLSGTSQTVSGITIERSELETVQGSCPGCPREFKVISEKTLRDFSKPVATGEFEFLDRNVKQGFLYDYKIKLCDSA